MDLEILNLRPWGGPWGFKKTQFFKVPQLFKLEKNGPELLPVPRTTSFWNPYIHYYEHDNWT